MGDYLFSERVNAVSSMISNMTPDPSERLGIATALCEIYKFEIRKYLGIVTPPNAPSKEEAPAEDEQK